MAFLLSATACIPEFDEDLSLVEDTRVLAVRVEPAESEESDEVSVTALIAAPEGERAFAPEWAYCHAPKPLSELGPVAQTCIAEFSEHTPTLSYLGAGESIDTVVPEDACRVFGPIPPDATSGDSSARPVDADETGGFYQPILAGNGLRDQTPAFGRLRLSCGLTGLTPGEGLAYRQAYRPNENPEVDRLTVTVAGEDRVLDDGDEFSAAPGDEVSFEVRWAECPREQSCGDGVCGPNEERSECPEDCSDPKGCRGAETYAVFDKPSRELRMKREGIAVAWYSDVGGFHLAENGVASGDPETNRETNSWTVPEGKRRSRLWIVVRDERGGVGFRSVFANIASE